MICWAAAVSVSVLSVSAPKLGTTLSVSDLCLSDLLHLVKFFVGVGYCLRLWVKWCLVAVKKNAEIPEIKYVTKFLLLGFGRRVDDKSR